MARRKKHLLIIDPQGSFCRVVPPDQQQVIHDGELCVPGAWEDMLRLAKLIDEQGDQYDDITVTHDSHNRLHIAHQCWFKNAKGDHPQPFMTMVEENDKIIGGWLDSQGKFGPVEEFFTTRPKFGPWTKFYLAKLRDTKRYPHMIWPYHCLIGSPGATIVPPLLDALLRWEERNFGVYNKITKGSNIKCEHFGAVRAEVPDPEDPETGTNTHFVGLLSKPDMDIDMAGEALGHCMANTARDTADEFPGDEFPKRLTLLIDATSSVKGLEFLGDAFLNDFTKRGMKTRKTTDAIR